jgi:acetyl esterase/lipase
MLSIVLAVCMLRDDKVDVTLGTVYRVVGDVELKMDLYRPKAAEGPLPAVVVIHGGAWVMGDRKDMEPVARAIAESGMLAANIQYRLAPRFKYPAFLDDAQAAVRYLRANAEGLGIDPKRIAAAGASAGGHIALMLGFTDTRDPAPADHPKESSRVRAVLNIFGPTDLGQDFPPSVDPLFQMVLGKPKAEAAEEIKQGSPLTHLDAADAPVFTVHGTADAVVPIKQTERLSARLKELGVRHETVIIEGMGHDAGGKDPDMQKRFRDALARGIAFLRMVLAPVTRG